MTYTDFKVSQQRSGSLTLTWVSNDTFTSQSLLVDSDNSGLKTLVLDGAARTVTLSSDNITVEYGTNINYSFRIIGTKADGSKVKSANIQEAHFYELLAPAVEMVGVPDGIKLTFTDSLPGLTPKPMASDKVMAGNEVTDIEVSLSYVDDVNGLDLDSYVANVATNRIVDNGNVLFIGDPNNSVNTIGGALVNGKPYEVSVRYITNELGFSPATLDETVIPTDQFSAPRNVAVARPGGDDAANASIAVSFNGPANDINPNGSDKTFVKYYEVWFRASATEPAAITNDDLNESGNPVSTEDGVAHNWQKFGNDVTTDPETEVAGDGSAYTATQIEMTPGELCWFIVRAVRDTVSSDENDPDAPNDDGKINGLFSAPVSGLIFNYVNVAAPIITGYTTQDSTSVSVKCEYPTQQGDEPNTQYAATIFQPALVGSDLGALGYSSKFVVKYADNDDGTNSDGNASTDEVEFAASPALQKVVVGAAETDGIASGYMATHASDFRSSKQAAINLANNYLLGNSPPNAVAVYKDGNYWGVARLQSKTHYNYGTVDQLTVYTTQMRTLPVIGTIDFSALGVRKYITSATYVQKYKGVTINEATAVITTNNAAATRDEFTSEDASDAGAERIFGSTFQPLTTFSAPEETAITQSLTYDSADKTPLSVGKGAGDGKLAVDWTALANNNAFTTTAVNTYFFPLIKYRILVSDADGDAVTGLGGVENLTGSSTTVTGLDIDVNYSLKLQAYFDNPENAVVGGSGPSTDQEVTGAQSANAVTDGTTPFYYPDAVIANSDAPSVYGANLDKLKITWDAPEGLNGVGSAGSLTELRYRYVLTTNGVAADPKWVSTAYDEVASNFGQGNGYQTSVWSGYQAAGTDVYDTTSAAANKYDIYYAEVIPPTITLSTDAVVGDGQTEGVVTATYTDGGNDDILVFVKVNSSISPDDADTSTVELDSGRNATNDFTGLTNGTQYKVSGTVTHSFGGKNWTSLESDSGDGEVLGGIPYGKPIIDESSVSLADQVASVSVNPNGRFLRESLFVGVPGAYDANDIGVQQTNVADAASALGSPASANNAVTVTVASNAFGYALSEALIVVENAAGSDVFLAQASS